MKTKFFFILNIAILIIMPIVIIYQLFIAETPDVKLIVEAGVLFVVYLLGVLGIKRKRSPLDFMIYQEKYGHILGDAFKSDKTSYHKLMKAITLYNENKYDKAITLLDELYVVCAEADDFMAVLSFKALCLEELHRENDAIAAYEELLTHNASCSLAWSNLGLLYRNEGRFDDAMNAYLRAVDCDPENSYAYNNLGNICILKGEYQLSLEYARRALELNPKLAPSMSNAALACKVLGDIEGAREYCERYRKAGGDYKALEKIIG